MTATEQALLETLQELERAAASIRTAAVKPDLHPILERLDRLGASLPADAPGDLRHYLQRGSYEKARLFLLGRAHENAPGTC